MKAACIAFLLACGTLLASCAHEAPMHRVSPDYLASGNLSGVRAFFYGPRTVVEFAHAPAFLWIAPAILSITDANGVDVGFEKEGRYYRLSRRLDHFTVWVNGRSLVFQSVRPVETASFPAPGDTAPTMANGDDEDQWSDVRKLSETQLAEIRQVIDITQTNTGKTVSDSPALDRRVNAIGSRSGNAAMAIVHVNFAPGHTAFKPGEAVKRVLAPAAKLVDRVSVHGRTDAQVAGPNDARIALGRALSARNYLIEHGVSPDKITVDSQADGDFIAPNDTKAGRALNRRVEIELLISRSE